MPDYIQSIVQSGRAGFSIEAGEAQETYYVTRDELLESVNDILGTAEANNDEAGSIKRSLPKAHPFFTHLYASSISIVGLGQKDENGNEGRLATAQDELEAPTITSQYWEYPIYAISVTFTSRPYAVLSDDSLTEEEITYYLDDDTTATVKVKNEWARFTDFNYAPAPEFAYAQHGQMRFFRPDGKVPDSYTFSGYPRMTIPEAGIQFYFYSVPLEYMLSENSVLVEYVGRVNQLPWFGWPAGALLYMGAKIIRRYPPPIPEMTTVPGGTAPSTRKLCDLELTFKETVRTSANVPTYGTGNTNILNHSYIAAGHNLQPFLSAVNTNTGSNTTSRGFYYAGSDTHHKTPVFPSAPFQLLFRNPDAE